MYILQRWIMGLVLIVQSIWDLHTKEIPTMVSAIGGITGFIVSVSEGRGLGEIILSCIPGVICFICAKMTNGAVGDGDAILLIAMGMTYSLAEIGLICVAAYSLAAAIALVLIVVFHKKKNYELPFVPFFTFGWMVEMLVFYGGKGC